MRKATVICFGLLLPFFAMAQQPPKDKGFVTAGNLHIYYQTTGSGKPLIFLHAGYMDHHMWDEQAAYFSKYFKVIVLDMPGHGRTTGQDTTVLVQDFVRTVMDSLHLAKASVAGLSFGSACAVEFALAYPERLDKLVLGAPGLRGSPDVVPMDTMSRRLFLYWDSISTTASHEFVTETFTRLWCDGPYRKPTVVNAAARSYVYNTAFANNRNLNKYWPTFGKLIAAGHILQIHAPLLIITGSDDVPFINAIAAYVHSKVQGSRLEMVPGVAHMINLEKPAEYNRLLKAFLVE